MNGSFEGSKTEKKRGGNNVDDDATAAVMTMRMPSFLLIYCIIMAIGISCERQAAVKLQDLRFDGLRNMCWSGEGLRERKRKCLRAGLRKRVVGGASKKQKHA
eukprot:4982819-Pyramimonas_sp.AAC.1